MRTAFIFPGQGSQFVGMGKALAQEIPPARAVFEEVDEALGEKLSNTIFEGPADELASNPDVQEFYLGLTESGERRNYRDVKHYKRRKRWL